MNFKEKLALARRLVFSHPGFREQRQPPFADVQRKREERLSVQLVRGFSLLVFLGELALVG